MLKLRTDTAYVAPTGRLTQAGYEALQGQFDGQSAASAGLDARLLTVETETSFIRRQAAITASGQTTIPQIGVPSWANRITITMSLLSTNGATDVLVQVGDGAYVTTGYVSTNQAFAGSSTNQTTATAGFHARVEGAAGQLSGVFTIFRQTGNTWVCSGMARRSATAFGMSAGEVTLSGALDRVRLNTGNGTDTFDAGSVSFSWE